MSPFHTLRISRAPMAALTAVGVFWGGFAAFVPDIKSLAGASDRAFGLALILSALGGMVSMYLGPRVGAALGRRVLPVTACLLVPAFGLPLIAQSVPLLALALFGMGAAVAILDISANVRISVLEERHGLHLMNLCHAGFSFAFAGAAAVASLARGAGWPATTVLPLLAVIGALLALLMVEGRDWQPAPKAPADARATHPWAAILPAAAILFAAFICENATEAWSALHIERNLGGAVGHGGFGPMMLGLMMGFGRLSGQFIAVRLGEERLVVGSAALGVVGAVLIALATTPGLAIIGVAVLGLGVAVVVPSANSVLGRHVRADQRGFAISRAWMIGFTGFFIGPTAMGLISQAAGLSVAFGIVALVMATIIPSVLLLARRGQV